MVFSNSTAVGVRRDLHGVLMLDTALQTPVSRPEDPVRLELLLAEVIHASLFLFNTTYYHFVISVYNVLAPTETIPYFFDYKTEFFPSKTIPKI